MGAFYPQWIYRSRISVVNPPTVTGYQVKVEIPWQPGMNDDFSDLRFSDYYRTLPYWIEDTATTNRVSAVVWVKLTEINEAAREFFCYYGNGGAVSESSGDNTFLFYDHFLAVDTNKWTYTGTPSYSGSKIYLPGVSCTNAKSVNSPATTNTALILYGRSDLGNGVHKYNQFGISGIAGATQVIKVFAYNTSNGYRFVNYITVEDWVDIGASYTGTHRWEIRRLGTSASYLYIDNSLKATKTSSLNSDTVKVWLNIEAADGYQEWDWVALRTYNTQTEPTCTPVEFGINPLFYQAVLLLLEKIPPLTIPSISKFYPGWLYKSTISVTNPPTVTGYQVKVEIQWQPGMSDDFSDLRFSDYYRTLPYWIETSTIRSTATVWIKLTEINEAAREFFCYYGNGGASSESSGTNTFDLFDHFDGAALDTSIWTQSGATSSFSNSILEYYNGGADAAYTIKSNTSFSTNMASRTLIKFDSYNADIYNQMRFDDETGLNGIDIDPPYRLIGYAGFAKGGSSSPSQNLNLPTDGSDVLNYRTWDIIRNGTTNVIVKVNGSEKLSYTSGTYVPTIDLPFGILVFTSGKHLYVDWTLVRKYQSSEPTCTIARYGINWIPPRILEYIGTGVTYPYTLTAVWITDHITLTWSG